MRRRKKGRLSGTVIAAVVAAALLAFILLNHVFVVRTVEVVGSGSLDPQAVARLSGIRMGARLGSVSESSVRTRIESDGRLAYVGLERRYPSRIVLTVRERSRDAMVIQGGNVLILDSDAYVIEIADQLPEKNVLYVTGMRPSNYAVGRQLDMRDGRCAAMKAIIEALKSQNAGAYVSEISVADIADLRIVTRTGLNVALGDAGNMPNKIAWMASAVADLESRGEASGQLDVASGTKADFMPLRTPAPADGGASLGS